MHTNPAMIKPSSRPKVPSFHRVYVLKATDEEAATRQIMETIRIANAKPCGCMDLTSASNIALAEKLQFSRRRSVRISRH